MKKRRRYLPPQLSPRAIEREFAREILRITLHVYVALEPLIKAGLSFIVRTDAEGKKISDLAQEAKKKLAKTITLGKAEAIAKKFGVRTSKFQKTQLAKQMKSVGINLLGGVKIDKRLSSMMESFVSMNVALITNIPTKIVGEVETLIARAAQHGTSSKELATQLSEKLQIDKRRAANIARDQIGTFYGQLNAVRQQEMGVDSFYWRTVGDERVRPTHRDREQSGKAFKYSDPPGGELPGMPINCRCWGEPVLDNILGG